MTSDKRMSEISGGMDEAGRRAELAADVAELERMAAAYIGSSQMDLGFDPITNAREILHFDEGADSFSVERIEDVEPNLEACKSAFNEGLVNRQSEFRRIASLPIAALQLWAISKGYKDLPQFWYLQREYEHLVMAACGDSDLAGFRTLPGSY